MLVSLFRRSRSRASCCRPVFPSLFLPFVVFSGSFPKSGLYPRMPTWKPQRPPLNRTLDMSWPMSLLLFKFFARVAMPQSASVVKCLNGCPPSSLSSSRRLARFPLPQVSSLRAMMESFITLLDGNGRGPIASPRCFYLVSTSAQNSSFPYSVVLNVPPSALSSKSHVQKF